MVRRLGRLTTGACFAAFAAATAGAAEPVAPQLEALNARLLAAPSASVVLTRWCRERALMGPSDMLRARTTGAVGPEPPSLGQDLQLGAGEAVRRRHVQLVCGDHVVSEADNFYVPARLTSAMNHELETTDHPFGLVVRDLRFNRRRLEAAVLREAGSCEAGGPRGEERGVLRHRAVLLTSQGRPFSEVVETYQCEVLAGPPANGR